MVKSYFKLAFRNLWRQRFFFVINIFGLAAGLSACLLIFLYVGYQYSFDRYHEKADRIYRLWLEETTDGKYHVSSLTPLPLAPSISSKLSGIDAACRVYKFNSLVKQGLVSFNEPIHIVDSNLFKIFDFKELDGSLQNALSNPHSIAISKSIANKYFGNTNPIGKSIEVLLGDENKIFTVQAIFADPPQQSSIRPNIIIPFSNAKYLWNEGIRDHRWFNVVAETYVLLGKGESARSMEGKMPSFLSQAIGNDYKPDNYKIHFQPLTKIHADASVPQGIEPIIAPKYLYILSTVGISILLLASINFITLSIGSSSKRAVEIGVRKVFGAERRQLVLQFWSESLIITFISFFLGLFMAVLVLPFFNQLVGANLQWQFSLYFFGLCFLLVLVTGLLAGMYPALIISGFKPIEVFKGKIKLGRYSIIFRKGLIVGQFMISIILIACAITVAMQLRYLQSADLGFSDKEHIVIVPTNMNNVDGSRIAELYKTELLKLPEVKSVSVSTYSFVEPSWASIGYTDDGKVNHSFQFNAVDPDFIKTMGIQLLQGRNFYKDNLADLASSVLVNETLVKEYGLDNPVGQLLSKKLGIRIIGVVKDFHVESLHKKIAPLVIAAQPDSIFRKADQEEFSFQPQPRISIKLNPGSLLKETDELKNAWTRVSAGRGFEFHYLDDALANLYSQDYRMGVIVKIASALALLIASVGLFGLAMLIVIDRTKEIGIRKVMGATVPKMVALLSKDLLKLVMIAGVIAFPLAWLIPNKWLQSFAYKIDIGWWVFIMAGLMALVVAFITISYQTIKAALANPVKSLRIE